MGECRFKRVLLKLSGESFCLPGEFGINGPSLESLAERIVEICKLGPQVAIVVGAGNFIRGATFSEQSHIPRNTADYMGMLATIINACALQETLEKLGQPTRVMSAIDVEAMCEPFIRRRALHHFERGRVVILAGGTGNPFFTTDTCAALRACELGVDVLLKATKVDGVYDDDPVRNPRARKFDRLTYAEVLARRLGVMDLAAVSLCMESRIPVIVFRLDAEGALAAAVRGEPVGTMVSAGGNG